MRDLSIVSECQLDVSKDDYVTYLYTISELTNQPLNHRHIFLGLSTGNVRIFDLETKTISSYFIDFKKQFKQKNRDKVSCIKCHPEKMHRILISYERTAAVVYSINKDLPLWTFQLDFDKHGHKGKLLAVDWMSANDILCGFEQGHLEIYAFGGGTKPTRVLKFSVPALTRMKLERFVRPTDSTPLILMEY